MSELDLQSFAIKRPVKVRWMFDQQYGSLLESAKSRSLREFLSKIDFFLDKYQIKVEHQTFNETLYQQWFTHYQQNMQAKGYDLIATADWFQKKIAEGKKVGGYFCTQNGQWIESSVYTVEAQTKAIGCFKTLDALPEFYKKHHSSSAVLDHFFIQDMLTQEIPWISLGSMRNAFGVINSVGNLDFKLRCGYLPVPKEGTEFVETVPLTEEGHVTFFGVQEGQLRLFIAHPADQSINSELTRFESDIISIRYLPYT